MGCSPSQQQPKVQVGLKPQKRNLHNNIRRGIRHVAIPKHNNNDSMILKKKRIQNEQTAASLKLLKQKANKDKKLNQSKARQNNQYQFQQSQIPYLPSSRCNASIIKIKCKNQKNNERLPSNIIIKGKK